jgi:Phage tail tube protein, GTA-gp10
MSGINPVRGDVELAGFILRPSYAALVAAESEIGSLFALLERTGSNCVTLSEMIALLWYCVIDKPPDLARSDFAAVVCALGLAQVTPAYRHLIEAALAGM